MKCFAKLLLISSAMLVFSDCSPAAAQRAFSNSRSGASAHSAHHRTTTGGLSQGPRWGVPGRPSSSDWTIRPSYSNNRSTSPGYNTSSNYGRSRHYSSRSPIVQYSTSPLHSHAYGHYSGPIQYGVPGFGHGYGYGYPGYLNSYHQPLLWSGLPLQYSQGYGLNVNILAAPTAVPYGVYSTPFLPAPSPVPPIGNPPQAVVPENVDAALSREFRADERPVINEFDVPLPEAGAVNVPTVDRIRSLRYQISGDSEFRGRNYADAEALYRTAATTAPGRRAPWLRQTWAQISQQQFGEAARSLKTALQMKDDPTSSWIPGEQLYGPKFASEAFLQNEELWKWLQRRPNSTDRLLLAAAFQQLRGDTGTSRELLNAAFRNGLQQSIVESLREIARDVADNMPPDNAPAKGEKNAEPPTDTPDAAIRIRGRQVIGADDRVTDDIGTPVTVPFGAEVPLPETVPQAKPLQLQDTPAVSPKNEPVDAESGLSLTIPTPE